MPIIARIVDQWKDGADELFTVKVSGAMGAKNPDGTMAKRAKARAVARSGIVPDRIPQSVEEARNIGIGVSIEEINVTDTNMKELVQTAKYTVRISSSYSEGW
jgi:hypothetical protein